MNPSRKEVCVDYVERREQLHPREKRQSSTKRTILQTLEEPSERTRSSLEEVDDSTSRFATLLITVTACQGAWASSFTGDEAPLRSSRQCALLSHSDSNSISLMKF